MREALNQRLLEMQDEIMKSIQESIQIPSVKSEATADAPYGEGCKAALDHALELAKSLGFETGSSENRIGWVDYGEGEELVGILGHLDVVPEGEGWEHPAFGGEIHDGVIWGRGCIDDKGPTIGAIYALKAMKDLGIKTDRKIRVLMGTDEETGQHTCAKHYVNAGYQMPTIGFTPDASFPAIFYEKGISRFTIGKKIEDKGLIDVELFAGGTAMNVVTPTCKLVVNGPLKVNPVSDRVTVKEENGKTIVEAIGVAAHGMQPSLGINAAILLLQSVKDNNFGGDFQKMVDFILEKVGTETNGESLGVCFNDADTGETTVNLGIVKYDGEEMSFSLEIRYPSNTSKAEIYELVGKAYTPWGFEELGYRTSESVYVPKNSELITKLMKVYREETGDVESEAVSIGGGTYAKEFPNMVAFGPMFPGDPDVIHQPNERVEVEKLMKSIQITAGAILELAMKND